MNTKPVRINDFHRGRLLKRSGFVTTTDLPTHLGVSATLRDLAALGFKPGTQTTVAGYWSMTELQAIRAALIRRLAVDYIRTDSALRGDAVVEAAT